MRNALVKIIRIAFVVGFLATCFGCYKFPKDIIAELKIDPTAYLTSVTIHGFYDAKPYSFLLKDTNTLSYLTKVLRNAGDALGAGMESFTRLSLNNRMQADLILFIPEGGPHLYICVENSHFSDGKYYSVTLVDPVPKELSDAFSQIRTGQVTNQTSATGQR
jgi:hypothetical protein